MISVGIIGSSGYVAGELIRSLLLHPEVNIDFLYSHSKNGAEASTIHGDLFAHPELKFTQNINTNVDVVFLCLGHGNSTQFLSNNTFSAATKIIDLSNDFRLANDANFQGNEFVYGLVDLKSAKIKEAKHIANPGCFATAIQLALLPLAKKQALNNDIHVNAITGSTGAGQSAMETTHFSWRNNNVSIYKAFDHQHLGEIGESITSLQKDFAHDIHFIPMRGNYTRGILATAYTATDLSEEELVALYKDFYATSAFTSVSTQPVHLKQVVNTNNAVVQVQKKGNQALITCAIDNLLKGAAGQAIENMNLMFGLDVSTGLKFKANYF